MPKPSKSSASSATRKKHARKVTGALPESNFTPQANKSKPSKKEIKKGLAPPPKKSYIPPSKLKPPPPRVDPLDSLESLLPSELVVILRRSAKKDGVTKSRALEELEVWVRGAKEEQDGFTMDVGKVQALVIMLPIWLHRYPALCVHPSRRIRQLAASLHALLLEIPEVRADFFSFLRDTGSEVQVSHILGSWCLSAWDIDRGVATRGTKSWSDAIVVRQSEAAFDPDSLSHEVSQFVLDDFTLARSVLPFIITTTLDPSSTFLALNPSASSTDSFTPNQFMTPGRSGPSTGTPPSSVSRRDLSGGEKPSSSRLDDELESVEDRNARLRVAAMGTLKWVLEKWSPTAVLVTPLHVLLSSSLFWTVLHYAARPPFHHLLSEPVDAGDASVSTPGSTQGLGFGQTIVRRAGWSFVGALVGGGASKSRDEKFRAWIAHTGLDLSDHTSSAVGLISSAILRSAFVEPDSVVRSTMWEPLLIFLTKIANTWLISANFESSANSQALDDDDDVESDSGSDTSVGRTVPTLGGSPSLKDQDSITTSAYSEFLAFLTLGCNGSPIPGYPTLIVILSTIPEKILSPTLSSLSEFFDALWSAVDGQALSTLSSERTRSTEAFLGAWGECLVWTTRKLMRGSHGAQATGAGTNSPQEVSRSLLNLQFGKLVRELRNGLRVQADTAGAKISVVYEKMQNFFPDILDDAWMHISNYAMTTISGSSDESARQYVLSFLAAMHQQLQSAASKRVLEKLVYGIAEEVLDKCQSLEKNDDKDEELLIKAWRTLEMVLERFGGILSHDGEAFLQLLDNLMTAEMSSLISQPSLILCYLKFRALPERRLSTWRLLLYTLGSSSLSLDKRIGILNVLLAAAQQADLVAWAKPSGKELQGLMEQILAEAFNGNSLPSSLIVNLLKMPDPFIDASIAQDLVTTIITTIDSHILSLIRVPLTSLQTLRSSLSLLLAHSQPFRPNHRIESVLIDILPRLFVLAFVIPQCSPDEEEMETSGLAKQLWKCWKDHSDGESRATIIHEVKGILRDMLPQTDVRPRPVAILNSLSHADIDLQPLVAVIPTSYEFDIMLQSTSADPIDPSLSIIEPLAPPVITAALAKRAQWNSNFDNSGFSPYARCVSALLHVLNSDRYTARENMWTLRHVLTLALFASEVLQVPGADSPVFRGQHVSGSELKEIIRLTQQVATLLLTTAGEGTWHQDVVDALLGKTGPIKLDPMGKFVRLAFEESKLRNTVRDSLVLHTVLQYVLRNATKGDADQWIELARGIEESALQTSLAISLAITEFAPEPLKLDRYRNELASKLSGIPPSKANTTGFRLLRCLSAVAPNPESEVIFLPQQRAVYLVQALQAWMGSDEDLDEKVESEVTLVLFNMVPILQTVQGAHWEFIMDLIESNIENSSFQNVNLAILFRTLRLLSIIRDLGVSNKHLREIWDQRSKTIFTLIRDLLAVKTKQTSPSVPRTICREQALSVVQELPGSLMDENTLSTMCHLLTDPSADNQKIAYRMLQQAAVTRTEHLVIEAGVDSENMITIDLPRELVVLLQSNINFDDAEAGGQDPLAYLLCWMITFDLFVDASLKVKTAYIDHLRTLDLIGGYFLPNIFEILGVDNSGSPFKLDPWVVDEYWLPLYDVDAFPSLQLLAAHVYYRALLTVPSLVRTWWEDLKDRQLSAAIAAFTSSYFSPVLIASELIHVKPPSRAAAAVAGDEALNDDTFNVRVALAINEVTATFIVDDQQMEIAIKLPTGYPLKTVDVRPIRRVGVPEKVWRKWLFAVQQIVTSHNGRIVDGLALFKKTVSLHFEGQVECAICYSILHVVDRSLPSKPCKTCKNRFHAGCLYKWFNTSHSSSCPLCRSDIM